MQELVINTQHVLLQLLYEYFEVLNSYTNFIYKYYNRSLFYSGLFKDN